MSTLMTLAIGLTRWWVRLYTRGLPPEMRDARRAEIESDLWEQGEDATANGSQPDETALEVFGRLLLGVPADLTWRVQAGLSTRSERSIKMNESWIMRGVLVAAVLVALVPTGLGISYLAGGGEWDSTFERVAASLLWIAFGLVMGAGLLLSKSRSALGLGLLAVGVIGISVMLYWAAVITVPIGLVLLAIAYFRAGRPGWPRGASAEGL